MVRLYYNFRINPFIAVPLILYLGQSSYLFACDVTHTTDSGEITSPNWPNNYPNNWNQIDCIIPDSGAVVNLEFTDFNTEAGWDFVVVTDENTGEFFTYDGASLPPNHASSSLSVDFTTDGSVTRAGWRAIWAPYLPPPICSVGAGSVGPGTLSGIETYQAETTLSTSGDVIVATDAIIVFEATDSITLGSSGNVFIVEANATFTASTTPVSCI